MPSSMSQLFGDRPVFGDGTRTCQEEGADVRIELGVPGEATVLCNFLQTWKIDPPIFGVNHLSTMSTDTTLCCSVHTRGCGRDANSSMRDTIQSQNSYRLSTALDALVCVIGSLKRARSCCFQTDVWMDSLANNLTDAHLLIWQQSDDTRINLGSEAHKRSKSASKRVKFLPKVEGHQGFHRRLCACDAFLDTPFYNAGSTTVSVLWAGVPLLTLAGDRTASRLAAGYMLGGGSTGLSIARNLGDYADLMVLLSRRKQRGWLAARGEVDRCRGGGCAMFDSKRTAGEMERVSRMMRRLGGAVQGGVSKYHLISADESSDD